MTTDAKTKQNPAGHGECMYKKLKLPSIEEVLKKVSTYGEATRDEYIDRVELLYTKKGSNGNSKFLAEWTVDGLLKLGHLKREFKDGQIYYFPSNKKD